MSIDSLSSSTSTSCLGGRELVGSGVIVGVTEAEALGFLGGREDVLVLSLSSSSSSSLAFPSFFFSSFTSFTAVGGGGVFVVVGVGVTVGVQVGDRVGVGEEIKAGGLGCVVFPSVEVEGA